LGSKCNHAISEGCQEQQQKLGYSGYGWQCIQVGLVGKGLFFFLEEEKHSPSNSIAPKWIIARSNMKESST